MLSSPDKIFPLIEWEWTESDCLKYCYKHGYDWEGLYNHFRRVSCFCCPLQRIDDYRNIRKHYYQLWRRMLDMDERNPSKDRGFYKYKTVKDN